MNNKIEKEELLKVLRTPVDISQKSNEEKAGTITLFFIGYIAKPIGISDELLQKCVEAFNDNRGKVEWEIAAVLKVLNSTKENNEANNVR